MKYTVSIYIQILIHQGMERWRETIIARPLRPIEVQEVSHTIKIPNKDRGQ
jgi:hypothetical protein